MAATIPKSNGAPMPLSIDSQPKHGQVIEHDGKQYTTIKEGLAHILVPPENEAVTDPKKVKEDVSQQSVFYNPIQQFNRDLSVLAIRAFGEDFVALKKAKIEKRLNDPRTRRAREKKAEKRREDRTIKRRKGENGEPLPAETVNDQPATDHQVTATGPDEAHADREDFVDHDNLDDSDLIRAENAMRPEASGDIERVADASIDVSGPAETATSTPDVRSTVQTLNGGTTGAPSRDIKPRFTILDALSATGLRALRYSHELPFVTSVTANDLSSRATASIIRNVKHNKLEDKIRCTTGNAIKHMYEFMGQEDKDVSNSKYDVIDLDPYGTAVPFLDAAVQAVNDGGLLCVTCTDAGVWASHGYLEKTFSQYGGLPMKGYHSHEAGLRLILHSIATTAARYGIAIEPLLSLSIDFYARVWVRVRKAPAEVKFLAGKTMLVYTCDSGCGAWTTQYLARNQAVKGKKDTTFYKHSFAQAPSTSLYCEHCGFKQHLSGPMYGGPLHNPAFIQQMLDCLPKLNKSTYGTLERIEGMLQTAYEETLFDSPDMGLQSEPKSNQAVASFPRMNPTELDHHPFFWNLGALAKVIHVQAPPEVAIKGALRHAGYRATRTHCKPAMIKTDAPWSAVWDIMREWARTKAPPKEGAIKEGTAGWGIMHGGQNGRNNQSKDKSAAAENNKSNGVESAKQGSTKNGVEASESAPTTTAPDETTPSCKRKIVFDEELGKDKTKRRLVRYQLNPRENWGPMNRAK